jgi:thiol:disulfide interchange protein DsbD
MTTNTRKGPGRLRSREFSGCPILRACLWRVGWGFLTVVLFFTGAVASLHAQTALDPARQPIVTLAPVRTVQVVAGRSTEVTLNFRIRPGFHINSSEPGSDLLIPTKLTLKVPTDIFAGRITYPEGKQMTFEFAPDEPLSVYEGPFPITALIRAAAAASRGTLRVHGELSYQACDDRVCYPPSTLPVHFDVRVQRPARR